AALELARAGCDTQIIHHFGDSTGLEDSYLIGRTPLNDAPMRGEAFTELALKTLHRAGV
ncbi:MAG: hypothetical protein K0Q72_3712, partial [Armatimonadetes bacterium]|nr:hypothetical protein [Armatimonadota bacterium]